MSGHLDRDELFYVGCIEDYYRAAKLQFPDRLAAVEIVAERIELMRKHSGQHEKRVPFIVSGMLLPTLRKFFVKDCKAIALIRATQTALAIERHRLKHGGQPPSTLQELVPDFLNAVPNNPFDGTAMRIRMLSSGYEVFCRTNEFKDESLQSDSNEEISVAVHR
ncbi:MAG: hypothetical protein U1F83_05980 [Verrucomicrobiota bacterium]